MGCNQSKNADVIVNTTAPASIPAPAAPEVAPVSVPKPEVVAAHACGEPQTASEPVVEEIPAPAEEQAESDAPAEAQPNEPLSAICEGTEEEPKPNDTEEQATEAEVEADDEPNNQEASQAKEELVEQEAVSDNQQEEHEIPAEPVEEPKPVVPEPECTIETEENPAEDNSAVHFVSNGITVTDKGIVYYNFKGTCDDDSKKDVALRKRYNDFKALHAEMANIMANEANVPASQKDKFATYPALPALPKANLKTLVKGRRNQQMLDEREVQFVAILNAVARHPQAYNSGAFQSFIEA